MAPRSVTNDVRVVVTLNKQEAVGTSMVLARRRMAVSILTRQVIQVQMEGDLDSSLVTHGVKPIHVNFEVVSLDVFLTH